MRTEHESDREYLSWSREFRRGDRILATCKYRPGHRVHTPSAASHPGVLVLCAKQSTLPQDPRGGGALRCKRFDRSSCPVRLRLGSRSGAPGDSLGRVASSAAPCGECWWHCSLCQ